MATVEQLFEALQKADAAGNTEDARQIALMIQQVQGQDTQAPLRYEDQNPDDSIDTDYLYNDPDWIEASKIVYRKNTGEEFQGTDQEAADYGIDTMGWFNYNLPMMALDASELRKADQREKDAFLYLMDAYDDLGISWGGTWRFVKGAALDPTTYVGLSTFGIGTAASAGGKAVTKEGLKGILKAGARAGIVAGVEGAVYGATDQTIRQSIEIDAGRRDGYDAGDIATSAGIGAAGGFIIGGAVGSAAKGLQVHGETRSLIRETEKILGGAERVAEGAEGKAGRLTAEEPQAQPTAPLTRPVENITGDAPGTVRMDSPEAKNIAPDPVRAVPDTPIKTTNSYLTNIVDTIRETGKRGVVAVSDDVQSMKVLRSTTQGLADLMKKAAETGEDLGGFLTKMEVKSSEMQVLKNAAQQATDAFKRELFALNKRIQEASNPQEIAKLRKQADDLEAMLGTVEKVDVELSTQSGRDLRMRREGLSVGDLRGVTVKSLMETDGLSRADAEKAFNRLVAQRERYLNSAGELAVLDEQIAAAVKQGDFAEAAKLKSQRKTLLAKKDSNVDSNGEPVGKVLRAFNKVFEALSEVMISMVFSPSTLIVNVVPSGVKMIYRPLLDAVLKDPFTKAAYKEAAASYGAMTAMVPSALKAAVASYKFERNMLLDDANRILEGGPVIPKKYLGGYLRFFPRMLQATDEFFSQIAYRGYVIGHATGAAYEDGIARGLKGKRLDAFVKKQTKAAADSMFSKNAASDERIIDILLEEAMDRGMSGAKANAWVKKQLNTKADLMRRAENEAGKDYVKDLLFKREFSGKTAVSSLAKGYEKFVRRHPIMRVAGQLFFRTPVRVFEEGIRMTPGLNMISPNFMADLAGKNGPRRQMRAQGEALLSYGMAGTILTLYAQGNITGAGPTDYKQRRQGENTDDFEPYTITFPNGDKWSFRNMDPLSTPLKIIVNALERFEMLRYRETQGEMVDATELEMALAHVKVGTGAIAQAIRDASLTQGIDQIWTGVELIVKENDTSGQLIKYVGQKLQMFVPNTWYKAQMIENPIVNDPASIEQMMRQRINPQDPKIPHMYTALGRVRSLSNPEANLYVFSPSTTEERKRGIPEKELAVEQELWVMTQVADTNFTAPYKHPYLGDVDLRTRYTQDGKETLYDRWMRYTHESGMIDMLYNTLVGSELPYGTPSAKGARITATKEILNAYREQAMLRILSEETGLTEEFIRRKVRQGELLLGQKDRPKVPF